MTQQVIFAGFGGQGVLLAGQLLAYAGMLEEKNVTWMPSYGPEMRGGAANCSVVVSDEVIGSAIVNEPDALIVMNRPSFELFEKNIVPGGVLIYNSSLIDIKSQRSDITIIPVPCNEIAADLGNSKVANMVILGAYLKYSGVVDTENVLVALQEKLGEGKQHLIPLNREAIAAGAKCVG